MVTSNRQPHPAYKTTMKVSGYSLRVSGVATFSVDFILPILPSDPIFPIVLSRLEEVLLSEYGVDILHGSKTPRCLYCGTKATTDANDKEPDLNCPQCSAAY